MGRLDSIAFNDDVSAADSYSVAEMTEKLLLKADVDSPYFTGTPKAPTSIQTQDTKVIPTQEGGTDTIATTKFVHSLIDSRFVWDFMYLKHPDVSTIPEAPSGTSVYIPSGVVVDKPGKFLGYIRVDFGSDNPTTGRLSLSCKRKNPDGSYTSHTQGGITLPWGAELRTVSFPIDAYVYEGCELVCQIWHNGGKTIKPTGATFSGILYSHR